MYNIYYMHVTGMWFIYIHIYSCHLFAQGSHLPFGQGVCFFVVWTCMWGMQLLYSGTGDWT